MGNLPHGVCLSPDDSTAYVSKPWRRHGVGCRSRGDGGRRHDRGRGRARTAWSPMSRAEPCTWPTPGRPTSRWSIWSGRREVKRLSAGRGAWGRKSVSRWWRDIRYQQLIPLRALSGPPSRSEVTVVGTERSMISDRVMIPEANLLQGVDVAPGGDYALVTLIRTKNLIPMTRVLQGWVMTNGIGVLWRDGRVDQLLLDEPDNYFSDPTDVVITPRRPTRLRFRRRGRRSGGGGHSADASGTRCGE